MAYAPTRRSATTNESNKLALADRAAHDWYRFVLSFPPHLVREYIERFQIGPQQCILDPFCGTGTTLVECKKRGLPSIGIEANPFAAFASQVKLGWQVDPEGLLAHARIVAGAAAAELAAAGIEDEPLFYPEPDRDQAIQTLTAAQEQLLLTNSISPLPLHKVLVLLDCLARFHDDQYAAHERLALAKTLVYTSSNLHFGPEVGVSAIKPDAPVVAPWLGAVRKMAEDLPGLWSTAEVTAVVHNADARQLQQILAPQSIDAVITSPPYPNEKDYTRSTRLESVILGFIQDKAELQALKRGLLRSNTRGVYKADDDDLWITEYPEIQNLAAAIEARRIELGKTSGFERLYARVTRLYFGGMARHFAQLRSRLCPGAQLAYVVGDQASYLQVMIRTGHLLADIAQSLGYEVVSIDLFRTRTATATKEQLREEVVVLRWPGR